MLECVRTELPIFIVDTGRQWSGLYGVSESGAMDMGALERANHILQQSPNTAALEILGSASFVTHISMWVCFTGSDAEINIAGQGRLLNQAIWVNAHQTIVVERAKQGMRVILGVYGGIDVPQYFSSSCGIVREGFGAFGDGKPMVSGTVASINTNTSTIANTSTAHLHHNTEHVPKNDKAKAHRTVSCVSETAALIDFVPNYQYAKFSVTSRYRFVEQAMQVTAQSDRMGLRLACTQPISAPKLTSSQALALGVIQIPPDGQPIVMGRDRQTHGGYPVIGTVPEYGVDQLAQINVGQAFYFRVVTIEQAIATYWLKKRLRV